MDTIWLRPSGERFQPARRVTASVRQRASGILDDLPDAAASNRLRGTKRRLAQLAARTCQSHRRPHYRCRAGRRSWRRPHAPTRIWGPRRTWPKRQRWPPPSPPGVTARRRPAPGPPPLFFQSTTQAFNPAPNAPHGREPAFRVDIPRTGSDEISLCDDARFYHLANHRRSVRLVRHDALCDCVQELNRCRRDRDVAAALVIDFALDVDRRLHGRDRLCVGPSTRSCSSAWIRLSTSSRAASPWASPSLRARRRQRNQIIVACIGHRSASDSQAKFLSRRCLPR